MRQHQNVRIGIFFLSVRDTALCAIKQQQEQQKQHQQQKKKKKKATKNTRKLTCGSSSMPGAEARLGRSSFAAAFSLGGVGTRLECVGWLSGKPMPWRTTVRGRSLAVPLICPATQTISDTRPPYSMRVRGLATPSNGSTCYCSSAC
eukprot:COSAG05_NODE_4756_length_1384_cov_1.126848_1_plen_147_part_00